MVDEKGRLFFSMNVTFDDPEYDYRCECNTSCPEHIHSDYYEILFITQGAYVNICDGITETAPAGTVLLFDVGAVHTFNTASSADSHFVFAAQKDAFEQYLALYFPNMNLFASETYIKLTISDAQSRYMMELAQLSGHLKLGRKFIKLLLYNVLAQIQIHSSTPVPRLRTSMCLILLRRLII